MNPSASPVPTVPTTDAATGPAVGVVEEQPEEIPAPVVIEKIVSDISTISSVVRPARVRIRSAGFEGSRLFIRLKKQKNVSYQIQLTGKKGKWKKGLQKRIKKPSVTLRVSDSYKTYYLRVRAVHREKGKKSYGKWSKVMIVKKNQG